ncbi:TPA: tyrosine-type recombinase/integrase [Escherichia coli]
MSGHIEQIRKGYFRVVVEAGRDPATGKRKRIVRYVEGRKADAEELLAKLQVDYREGSYVEPNKITVGEWIETWLNTYKKMDLRQNTWEIYKINFETHIKSALGAMYLQQLRAEHIQNLYQQKLEEGKSPATIHKIHDIIRGALKQAVKNKLILHNPAEAVVLPKRKQKEIKVLTKEQQEKFLKVLEEDRLGAAFLTLLMTGIRRSELLALTWEDIDFQKKTITITKGLVYTKEKGLVVEEPKTEKSKRTIPIPNMLLQYLRRHQIKMLEEGNYAKDKPVFCSQNGTYINPRNLNRKYYELCKKAEIEDVNLHALRHTFATMLLEAGVNLKVVQELLGHTRISTTADIYSHVAPEIKRNAVQKIEKILGTKWAPK